jgi:hypothetical protein
MKGVDMVMVILVKPVTKEKKLFLDHDVDICQALAI